ncbi:ABC transporter ATP-binding protein [Achromobacter sp. PAB15]|uniref:ABC transporter ATP-binding protein n=1 Tax=Achromobacter sp. PAB15 TaxID=3233048 RepID=UPI003F901C6C
MTALHIRGLDAGYGGKPVLQNLSAGPLAEGTVTALLGPNGSGKSTLLKTLAGLNPVMRGAILLDDEDLARASPARRAERAMYMPQALPKGVHMTVFESVLVAARSGRQGGFGKGASGMGASGIGASGMGMSGKGMSGNGAPGHGAGGNSVGSNSMTGQALMQDALAVINDLGISTLASRYLDELSGGQKQLASLAQALVRRPRLLLLDEPLSALDLNYQFHVMDVLRRQTRQHRLITLVVLHDLNIALRHADHALLLHRGAIQAQGLPADVVTPHSLREVYRVQARVERCPQGQAQVHVDGLAGI